MAFGDRLRNAARVWLGLPPLKGAPGRTGSRPVASPSHRPAPLDGARFRISEDNPTINYLQGLTILAPFDSEHRWRNLNLDEQALNQMSTQDIINLLADLSPDISKALWDYVRLANPGWECKVFTPKEGSETIDARGQALVDDFLKRQLRQLYGTTELVIDRIFINAFLRGAFMAELVLDNTGRKPLDLAIPDAQWTYFRIALDKERGPVWQPYQFQHGRPVPLVLETVRYVPIDPLPASPYGRAMVLPAVFTTLFAISMLHDLRRVVAQQGYPRLDVEVVLEELAKAMPTDLADDPQRWQEWINSVVTDVGRAYQSLEPDDAYIHHSGVKVNRPVGAMDTSALGAVDGIMNALDRQVVRALKTLPLMFGVPGGSETQANRQWEIYIAGVKSHQHTVESMFEHFLTLALRVQGLQSRVQFRFSEVRAAELLRDAQVEQIQISNAALKYDLGWLSQDEACEEVTGKPQADEPEPRIPGVGAGGGGQGGTSPPKVAPGGAVQAEPGSLRGNRRHARAPSIPPGFIQAAQQAFDQALPEYAGLLAAEVMPVAPERALTLATNGNGSH